MKFIGSVKFRLTLWYAIVLTFLLSIFAFFMVAELTRTLYQEVDNNLRQEAQTLKESLQPALKDVWRNVSPPENDNYLQAFFDVPDELKSNMIEKIQEWESKTSRLSKNIFMVRLMALDHTVISSNLSGWAKDIIFPNFERDSVFMELERAYQTIHFETRRPIRLYYYLLRSEKNMPILIIQVGRPMDDITGTLDRLVVIVLVTIPGTVFLACIAGWFLSRRFLRPIDVMIRESRQITAAYLKKRLPRSNTGDELDRLAETLNAMMDRLELSTKTIQDFSSDVSHELKTPLAIIRGEIDLALRRSRSQEDLLGTMKIIEGEVDELIRLVDDLLLLVRSDARQLNFKHAVVSLRDDVLMPISERMQKRARDKNIEMKLLVDFEAKIKGDVVYLKRLFSNLLDNALKFTPEGGHVIMETKPHEGDIMVVVSDTGIGIDPEVQEKVFSRFYRAGNARSQEGSGLGLNISKVICEAHDGRIWLESKQGFGTRVIVSLPILSS